MGIHEITTPILEKIQLYTQELVSKALGKSIQRTDFHTGFFDLGMDSKMTMELVTQLEEKLGHELYPTLLFEYQNIDELSNYLMENDQKAFENTTSFQQDLKRDSIPMNNSHEQRNEKIEDSESFIKKYLQQIASEALGKNVDQIDTTMGFFDLGMDSKMTMGMVSTLEEKVGHELYPTLLFEYQNIDELSQYLYENEKDSFTLKEKSISNEELNKSNNNLEVVSSNVSSQESDEFDIWETVTENEIISDRKEVSPKTNEPIAIVGLSGRYPQSKNIDELWENLKLGKDCVTEIPNDYWELDGFYSEDKNKKGRSYSKWGGFIDDADKFDPLFFGISPKAAENMDPQARIFLEESWKAIEDAGYNPAKLSTLANVGVFAGVFWTDYQLLRINDSDSYPSAFVSAIPNVTSYYLGLRGPSIGLDTQCSSSLTAIYLACESIRNSECDMALAGGVNVIVHPSKYTWLSDARFLSDKGRCESFGDGGNGYVPSEGVGVIVLKRLSQAEKDGDRIYGVIKGAAVNHGGRSSGLTVPNKKAQASVVKEAMKKAGITAEDYSYIEAHGTGTGIGDPIEVSGLNEAIQSNALGTCLLGSIKSNIGHSEAAAGIAGVTKVLLQMKHKQIVPSLHSKSLNKNIDFKNSVFKVSQELQDWNVISNKKRIAGVSGFGAGGSNAHLVIEEYKQTINTYQTNIPALILVSAKSEERLLTQIQLLNEYLNSGNLKSLQDMAYTLQIGRDAMDYRFVTVVTSIDDLKANFNNYLNGKKGNYVTANVRNNKSDFILKGSAGKAYIETAINEKEFESLGQLWIRGVDVDWSLMYNKGNKPNKISLPTYPFLKERYWVDADFSTKTINSKKLHPLVHENISTLDEQVFKTTFSGDEKFLTDHKVNGDKILPGVAYLEWVREAASRSLGTKITQLKNINWLQPIVVKDEEKNIEISFFEEEEDFGYEIFSESNNHEIIFSQGNVSVSPLTPRSIVAISTLKEKFSRKKSGDECYAIFSDLGFSYGPSFRGIKQLYFNDKEALSEIQLPVNKDFELQLGVLDSALQSILGVKLGNNEVALNLPFSIKQINIHGSLNGARWCHVKSNSSSYSIDVLSQSGEVLLEIIGLTTLPYAPKKLPKKVSVEKEDSNGFASRLFTTNWLSTEPTLAENAENVKHIVILTEGNAQITEYLKNTLEQEVVLLNGSTEIDFYIAFQEFVQSQLRLKVPIEFTVVYPNSDYLFYAFANGLFRTIKFESKRIEGKTLGIEKSIFNDVEALAELISQEQKYVGNEVRYINNKREQRKLTQIVESKEKTVGVIDGGVYIITGGTGGLGKLFASHIATTRKETKIILTGRSLESRLSKEELNRLNAEYVSCDITNKVAVNDLIENTLSKYGKINGIIHSAGVIKDSFLITKKSEDAREVLKPKIEGVKLLDQATVNVDLDFFVLFSSMAGVVGNYGQADYSSANAWLDFYAIYRNDLEKKGKRKGHCLSINWPLWANGGMVIDEDGERRIRRKWGVITLPTDDGINSFDVLLKNRVSQGVVTYGDKDEIHEKLVKVVNFISDTDSSEVKEIIVSKPQNVTQKKSIESEVLSLIADTIKLDVSRIEIDKGFEDYGLDSVMIVNLTQELNKRYPALDLSPMVLINSESISEFISILNDDHADLFVENEVIEKEIKVEETQNNIISKTNKVVDESSFRGEVLSLLASTIKLDVSRIELDKGFEDYGLDSVMIVNLTQELNKRYPELDLSPMVLINSESISEFISILNDENGNLFLKEETVETVVEVKEPVNVSIPQLENETQKNLIEDEVLSLIASTIKLDVSRIELDKGFEDYGLDSVMIVNLTQELNKRYPELDLSPMVLINSESISEFISSLKEDHGDLFFQGVVKENSSQKVMIDDNKASNIIASKISRRPKRKRGKTNNNKVREVDSELSSSEDNNKTLQETSASKQNVIDSDVKDEEIMLPLTEGQKGLWFIQNTNPESGVYNIPLVFKISNEVTNTHIERVYKYLLKKHAVFRLRFKTNDFEGNLHQYVANEYNTHVAVRKVSNEDNLGDTFRDIQGQPIDLSKETTKLTIVESNSEKHIVFVLHHIVFDGSSIELLVADLKMMLHKLTTGEDISEPILDMSYFEHVQDEITYLKSEQSKKDLQYWNGLISTNTESLKLPYDQISNKSKWIGKEGKELFSIKGDDLSNLKSLTKTLKVNLSVVILSVFKTLLNKLTNSNKVVVKMPTKGRYDKKYKNTIGYFVNTILNTGFVSEEKSFAELVEILKTEFMTSIGHLKYPYSMLLTANNDLELDSLYSVSFIYQNIFNELKDLKEDELFDMLDDYRQNMINDYSLEVIDLKDELIIELKYKKELFSSNTIKRHLAYFQEIIKIVSQNSNIALNEINVTTDSEKKLLLEDFNNTDFEYPLTNSVIDLFEAQVKKNPTAIALQSNEEKVTYKELASKSDQLASFLQDNGVTKDTFVGIYMDRSIDAVTAMLAILKAGGAYVPLDPDYPASRVNYILEDAIIDGNVNNTTKIVLLQKQLESRFSELSKSVEVTSISIDADWFANQDKKKKPKNIYKPSNLAYVIYTSGSTGKPKGVLIEHRSFIDLIEYQKFYFDVNSEDQFLQFSNFSFDASVEQHFLPLVSGATLHITPKEDLLDIDVFKEILISRKITHLHAVPSFLREIPFIPNTSLKRIISGGDVFEPKVIENWGNKGIRIIDKYGPTETTVSAIQRDIKLPIEEQHIGKPIGNTKCYVVDSFFNLQPLGVPGELCIGGAGLARGYLNRADLTGEKFVDNPFGKGKVYKTGDLVRWLPSGNIEFLGRIDNQVKVNGFRIEIGEVETALNSFDFITNAVVVAKEISGSKQLVAYCKINNTQTLNISEVKAMLSELIPEYMIPKFIVETDEIPLTPNGKVNRKLLTEKPLEVNSQASYIEPITATEKQLSGIWEELLNVQQVGLLDNFFDLGGHSLMLIKLLSRIKKEFTVNLSISNVFASKSLKELAQVIDSNESKAIEPIKVLENRTTGILSLEQSRLWFLSELGKGDQYNIPKVFRVKGAINAKVLENSLNVLIQRHEVLRTNFKKNKQGDAYQEISNDVHLDLIQEDFSLKTKNILETSIRRKTKLFLEESFDLSEDLLIRALIIKAADEDYVFALSIHHIVFDGWSSDIFMQELREVYQALSLDKEISLPELPVQYIDYAAWQSKENQSEAFEKGVSYWKQKLEGYQDLELPLDNPRPKNPTGNGKYIYKKLKPASKKDLKEISKQLGGTLFTGLLSSVYVLLNKLSGQEDICLGIPVANRSHKDVEGVIGFFVNTIVNRIQLSDKETVASLFSKVQKELISGQDFQNISFDKVVDATQTERKTSISPIFQVIVNYLTIEERYTLGDATLFNEDIDYDFAKFDLNIDFIDLPEGDLLVSLGYNTDIFKDTTAEKILESLLNVLEIFGNETQKSVKNISIVSDEERITLLEKFNPSSADYSAEVSIHEMFTKQAANNPNAVALVFEGETISYGELDKRSNQLALYLQDLGVQKETLVGVCMDKSIEMMVSILGILKAGGAYVPIDATYPKDRIEYIIQDSIIDGNSSESIKLILKQEDVQLDIFEGKKDFSVITIVKQWEENKEILQTSGKIVTDISGSNLAYVMYTSGSTGKPKGVMVEHKSVVRLVVNAGYLELNSTNTLLSTGAFSFDATTFDFFGALLNGGKLVLATKEDLLNNATLKQVIDDNKVDTFFITSSWLNQIVNSNIEVFENVSTVLSGGERLAFNHIKKLKETYKDITVINGYGPTENTTFSTTYVIPEVNGDIPIGTPISDDQAYIVDSNNQLQPIGVYGELCFGGNGVARGYLNRTDLTQEKFIDNPFGEGRIYKTGDIARWTPEGLIDFLGRKDNQVKIRGFRIELGEIEEALNKLSSITDSTVVVKEHAGTKQLIAYCLGNSTEKFNTKKIKSLLEKELPSYMIPKFIFEIEEIPLTPNGKKNRKFFENKQLEIESDSFKAPITEIQKSIANIWQELLEVSKVGLEDNFFELGGHSLLITKLLSLVNMNYNVSIPVGKIFESPTLQEFAALVEETDAHNYQAIERVSERQWQPLSFAQQRLWFLSELGQGEQYHVPYILKIKGELHEDLLQQSLNILIQRHESLRTRFVKDNKGKACQFIDERVRFKIEKKSIVGKSLEAEDIHQICQHFINEPFNLSEDTLIRAMLLKLSDSEQIFVLSIHHIVFDGWSLQIFIKELKSIYENLLNNTVPALPELPIQYLDYAAWEQELALQKDFKKKIKFWKNHLEGFTDLAFPTDFPRPKISSGKGKRIVKNIDASTKAVLENFSNENGGTLFASLLSSVYILLHKYSAQEDICIGVPVANRAHQQVENLIGFFVNTVVNRIQLRPDISLETLFNEVQKELIVGQENQEVPFDKVVEALQPKRETSITPIFQVMVNYLQMSEGFSLGDTEVTIEESSYGRVKFDLNFDFVETKNEGLFISFGYSTDLFSEQTAERLLNNLITIINTFASNSDKLLSNYSFLNEENRQQLLVDFNTTAFEYEQDNQGVLSMLMEQVSKNPDSVAVKFGKESLTYQELYKRCSQLALHLQTKGVSPDTLVGIFMERSVEAIVTMFGILMAGAAYVPIDPEYPTNRIEYIVNDAILQGNSDNETHIVITQERLKEKLTSIISDNRLAIVDVKSKWSANHDIINSKGSLKKYNLLDKLAYVIYTSGSTGNPKGVLIEHQNVINLIKYQTSYFGITTDDNILLFSSFSFDASIEQIYLAVLNGATIHVTTKEELLDIELLQKMLLKSEITHIHAVPSFLKEIPFTKKTKLKRIISGGDVFEQEIVTNWEQSGIRIINEYGPTETTVTSIQRDITNTVSNNNNIGKPLGNTLCYVVDQYGEIVPVGVPGELWIGGKGVARGYLNREELTNEKFINNPFEEGKVYKTGDLVKWLPDGTIEFLGRIDQQVKVRGFRIELGEIESVLNQIDGVKNAVVVAKDFSGNKQLVAYVEFVGKDEVTLEAVDEYLRNKLPEYMVPSFIIEIDTIPLTPNKKVDRKYLESKSITVTQKDYVAPSSKTEKQIASLWSDILNINSVGVHDNFFDLGGHSLLIVQLNQKVKESFGNVAINIVDFINNPTVFQQAKLIDQSQYLATHLIPFSKHNNNGLSEESTFIIPGMPGVVEGYYELGVEFSKDDQSVFGIQMKGILPDEKPATSIKEMAEHNINVIKDTGANRIRLIAHSYGGTVVLEMLHQLSKTSIEVTDVVFIDSYAPKKSGKMTEIYKGLLSSLATIVNIELENEEITKFSKRVIKQPKHKRKEFVYNFLLAKGGIIDKEFYTRLYDVYINAMKVKPEFTEIMSKEITLIIANATPEKIEAKHGWANYCSTIEVIPTKNDHFELVRVSAIQKWKNQITKLVM